MRVFLSYSMVDAEPAIELQRQLSASGHEVLTPRDDAGDGAALKTVMRNCAAIIVLGGRSARLDPAVKRDLRLARRYSIPEVDVNVGSPHALLRGRGRRTGILVDPLQRESASWAINVAEEISAAAPADFARRGSAPELGVAFWAMLIGVVVIAYFAIGILRDGSGFVRAHLNLLQFDIFGVDPGVSVIRAAILLVILSIAARLIGAPLRAMGLQATDVTIGLLLLGGASLFLIAFTFVPLALAVLFALIYAALRPQLVKRPRLTILPVIALTMGGALWGEELLYKSLRSEGAVVLLLPTNNCAFGSTICHNVSYEYYTSIHQAMRETLDGWPSVRFLPSKPPAQEQYARRYLAAYDDRRRTANLVRDTLIAEQATFDRALVLSLAAKNSACGAETVILDARLKNWEFGKSPLLAYGEFVSANELEASKSSGALLGKHSIPHAAFFFAIDLVQRFSVLGVEGVTGGEIESAVQRLLALADRFIDDASAAPDAAVYAQLLSQARSLDDTDLQLGALEIIALWLIDAKNSELLDSPACREAQAAEVAGRAASFGADQ